MNSFPSVLEQVGHKVMNNGKKACRDFLDLPNFQTPMLARTLAQERVDGAPVLNKPFFDLFRRHGNHFQPTISPTFSVGGFVPPQHPKRKVLYE